MEALKPCPFCGSSRIDSHFVRDGRRVSCGCGASVIRHHGRSGDTEGDVRAAWNTRANPAPALLEALKETLASLTAAISTLERSPKTAAASDKMFDLMLSDYRKSADRARQAISQALGGE